ncbi:hypothetical protein HYALB_00003875 [Hymenoscyphus albidus]|uniref:Uncharacterized protein n=1 Tax=Hymenoscyphus albidus TaxID=595503 RepID=A0A9N9LZH9_9HELO|nr:hypothetical protein HYALB_00003875 [Hymenoscyphus albidus]
MDYNEGTGEEVDKGKGRHVSQGQGMELGVGHIMQIDRKKVPFVVPRGLRRALFDQRKAEVRRKYGPPEEPQEPEENENENSPASSGFCNPMALVTPSTTNNLGPLGIQLNTFDSTPPDFSTMTTRPRYFDMHQKYYFDGEHFMGNLILCYGYWFDEVELQVGEMGEVFSLPFNKRDRRARTWAREKWNEIGEEMMKVPGLKYQPYLVQWHIAEDFLHAFLPPKRHRWFGPKPPPIPDCYQLGAKKQDVNMTEESASTMNLHTTTTAESSHPSTRPPEEQINNYEMNTDSLSDPFHSYEMSKEAVAIPIPYAMNHAGSLGRDDRSTEEPLNDFEMDMSNSPAPDHSNQIPVEETFESSTPHAIPPAEFLGGDHRSFEELLNGFDTHVNSLREPSNLDQISVEQPFERIETSTPQSINHAATPGGNNQYAVQPFDDYEMNMDTSSGPSYSNQASVEEPGANPTLDPTIPVGVLRQNKRSGEEPFDERESKKRMSRNVRGNDDISVQFRQD